jgi:polar amino acid transport system substrate-binding protein
MSASQTELSSVVGELAPHGALRAALNYGNVVLVRRGAAEDTPTGVSPDLARELARRLGVPLAFVPYERAGDVSGSAAADDWDICFLAVDPLRANVIAFTEPYVAIEGSFLVRQFAASASPGDVERLALKVGATKGSAYELHLSRVSKSARIVCFDTFEQASAAMLAGEIDALAGVRQAMEMFAAGNAGYRVLPESFMSIRQAIGTKIERPRAAAYLRSFVDEMKSSGFVAAALSRSGQGDVTVP